MKTWFITGCSSGIGRGIAKAALASGDQAIVTARDSSKLESLVKEYPETAAALPLDLNQKMSITHAIEEGKQIFGGIDILVNNAGYSYRGAVEEAEMQEVNKLFQTNFFGPIELIKQVLPQMRQKRSGAIINLSSISAIKGIVGSGYYAAAKSALDSISEVLAMETEPLGIKVMTVEPGAIRTRFNDTSLKESAVFIDDYKETAAKSRKENLVDPNNQIGDPDKVGQVIVELIGKDDYPRKILLGSDAISFASETYQKRLEQVEKWKTVSLQTDYE
ncbi:short-chain dehydrogenase/reductase [Tetragenococcus halophilus subsp. flandriensis]|uniref:oxidoreductase n=1 Tax=Tetragenococcus halophilus TaxID=51669 RepID=UPI0023E949D3|nr:oxidoreductase [Tetragenococcus halophilus]GMA08381.1 short-chain dehydrogenase/reductase [Tetragenococcus halophilus subsp. flandriensis]